MIVYGLFAGVVALMLVVIVGAAATTAIVRAIRRNRGHAKARNDSPGPL